MIFRIWINSFLFFIAMTSLWILLSPNTAGASQPVFESRGIGGAGGMYCVAIAPHDENFMLLVFDMEGVYRSLDGGRNWELVPFAHSLKSPHFSPHPIILPHRIYWVTDWMHLCHSEDQGRTWNKLPPGPWAAPERKGKRSILSIALVPDGEETLLVSTAGGVWIGKGQNWKQVSEKDGGPVFTLGDTLFAAFGEGELVRSDDFGANWTPLPPLPGRIAALAASSDPAGNSLMVASVRKKGLYRSEDMGKNWERCKDTFENETVLAIPQNQTKLVYAAQTGTAKTKQLLRSTDGGKRWEKAFRMPKPGKAKGADGNVELSWLQRKLFWSYYITRNGFAVSQSNPDLCLLTTQGELFISRDGGNSWSLGYTKQLPSLQDGTERYKSIGLEVTATYGYFTDPHDAERAYICFADIGIARSLDKGISWSWTASGSPWKNTFYDLAFDPLEPGKIYAAAANRHEIFNFLGTSATSPAYKPHQGGVVVSDNFGASWKTPYTRNQPGALPVQVCSSVALDPASPPEKRTLFACIFGENDAAGVYVSRDSGKTWAQTPGQPGVLPNRHLGKIRLHPETSELYCLVTGFRARKPNYFNPEGGGLWRSSDEGKTWVHLTKGSPLCRWATSFAFDPKNKDVMFITAASPAGSTGVGGVYKTDDGGKTWNKVLAEREVYRLAKKSSYEHFMTVSVHPENTDLVFSGSTLSGLFISTDGGKQWRWCKDFPFAAIQSISFDPRNSDIMYVCTMGAGIWTASLKQVLQELKE